MADATPDRPKDACPRCGKSAGLTFWHLLPSSQRNRVLACKACGGHYDLSNRSKMGSIIGGMVGMAFGLLVPFQWIVKAGHGTRLSAFVGIAVAAVSVGLTAAAGALLTLGLEQKP